MAQKSVIRRRQGKSHIKNFDQTNKAVQTNWASRSPNGAADSDSAASPPRWILYHGTTSARLNHILRDDCLRISGGVWKAASTVTRGRGAGTVGASTAPKFTAGMVVKFIKYRDGETGMFTPGEEIYIHSVEEREHSSIKSKMVKFYICTKASDAEAAKADPKLHQVEAEEIAGSQLRIKTDPDPRDPMSAYVPDRAKTDPKLSLTTEQSVAEYWACLAVFTDRHDRPQEESNPVVLVLNGERLFELNHPLGQFDYELWGDEQDDVETGILCLEDIDPLTGVLIGVEHVTPERYDQFIKDGREAVWPPAPPLARIELLVISDTIGRLAEGDITPTEADAVVSALAALRSAMSRGSRVLVNSAETIENYRQQQRTQSLKEIVELYEGMSEEDKARCWDLADDELKKLLGEKPMKQESAL
jgi:hypothetical protein